MQLAHTMIRVRDLERSLAFYEQAIRLDPRHRGAHNNMGAALRELGRSEEAITHLRQAVEMRRSGVRGG